MPLDYFDLAHLRKTHPSWRLMMADNGPLVISFFDRVFREDNTRYLSEDELTMQLEDYLFALREHFEDNPFSRSAREYLDEWTASDRQWLRKFYPQGSDIPHYDLTPGTERVLQWADGLFGTGFVGTESRLNTSIELLRQIVHGVEEDKDRRIKELEAQRQQINRQIKDIKEGHIEILGDRQVRERFLQFQRTARELLSDFRAVEHHFRELDLRVREQIAAWDGEKGELLENFFGSHDQISESDEGQSFKAFWDFLMSPSSQEEMSALLDRIHELESLADLLADRRLRRIHFDWMAAGEQTQRTVARLSKQLRTYLDNRAFWENRRITEILDSIEKKAVNLREDPPEEDDFMELEGCKPVLNLPMTQALFKPPEKIELVSLIEPGDEKNVDTSRLYDLVMLDKARLRNNIKTELEDRSQIRLQQIIEAHPLKEGLAELVTYVHLAEEDPLALIHEDQQDEVQWKAETGLTRRARLPRIVFNRRSDEDKKTL